MRISGWSSDVCSSDLEGAGGDLAIQGGAAEPGEIEDFGKPHETEGRLICHAIFLHMSGDHIATGDHRRGSGLPSSTPQKPALFATARWRRAVGIHGRDRKSVVQGKSVSVRVDLGGRRIIEKKIKIQDD